MLGSTRIYELLTSLRNRVLAIGKCYSVHCAASAMSEGKSNLAGNEVQLNFNPQQVAREVITCVIETLRNLCFELAETHHLLRVAEMNEKLQNAKLATGPLKNREHSFTFTEFSRQYSELLIEEKEEFDRVMEVVQELEDYRKLDATEKASQFLDVWTHSLEVVWKSIERQKEKLQQGFLNMEIQKCWNSVGIAGVKLLQFIKDELVKEKVSKKPVDHLDHETDDTKGIPNKEKDWKAADSKVDSPQGGKIGLEGCEEGSPSGSSKEGTELEPSVDSDQTGPPGDCAGSEADDIKEIPDEVEEWKTTDSKVIRAEGGKIELGGCEVTFPPGALEEDTEIELSVDPDQTGLPVDCLAITPILGCRPSMVFNVPVMVKMRTCLSATKGAKIPVTIMHRKNSGSDWEKMEMETEVVLEEENVIQFRILHFCGYVGGVSEGSSVDGKLHLRNIVYIQKDTSCLVSIFCKNIPNQVKIDQDLERVGYIRSPLLPENMFADPRDEIDLDMKFKIPSDHGMDIHPGSKIQVMKILIEEYCSVYFTPDPLLKNHSDFVQIEYRTKVNGEVEETWPLVFKWPLPEDAGRKSGGNATNLNITNNLDMSGTKNIANVR